MAQDLDKLAQEIQDSILAEERKVYSEKVIELFLNPKNLGQIKDADAVGAVTGPCGDTMQIWLKVRDDKIIQVRFLTDGCGPTVACGSMLTELVKSKSVNEALKITPDELTLILGGLPESHLHCALLSVNTLQAAIRDYLASKREPWKRLYRKEG